MKVRRAVCRTDLHVVDGDLPPAAPPSFRVTRLSASPPSAMASRASKWGSASAWAGSDTPAATAAFARITKKTSAITLNSPRHRRDGGFADYAVADAAFSFPIPDSYGDAEAAPLLCAGLIGYRSLKMAGSGKKLGIYGFGGGGAHCRAGRALGGPRTVTPPRPGDAAAQAFARSLGCRWVGGSDERPADDLDAAAIIFAPVGGLAPAALRAVRKGGIVVCGGIDMSDIPSFPYSILWGERARAALGGEPYAAGCGRVSCVAALLFRSRPRFELFP